MIKIGLIAPYPKLARLANKVSRELGIDLEVDIGNLEQGVQVAEEMVKKGMDVLISRGGTALLIKDKVEIPVVEIEVSGFDILKVVSKAQKYGKRIGLIGFPNVIYGTKIIESILNVDITEIQAASKTSVAAQKEELEKATKKILEYEIDVVIGDVVSTRLLADYHYPALIIESGENAFIKAVNEARNVAAVRKKELRRAKQFKTTVDFSYNGIITLDENGIISIINPVAEKILGVIAGDVIGSHINKIVPEFNFKETLKNEEKRLGDIYEIKDKFIACNQVPITLNNVVEGMVITFQDVTKIEKMEENARKRMFNKHNYAKYSFQDIVADSSIMNKVISEAKQYARVDSSVLITGETGVGKELIAQSIHNYSTRKRGPFVAINCAALPENLLESELFGYEEGAFTGAVKGGKKGLFELAHNGTIFLDEIAEMAPKLQARLLRVIEEREVRHLGGDQILPVDIRLLTATHKSLKDEVDKGRFRQDLYYRLNVLHIRIPPLREKKEDIPALVNNIKNEIQNKHGHSSIYFTDSAIEELINYNWPGNVRELKNIIERMIVKCRNNEINREDVKRTLYWEADTGEEVDIKIKMKGTLEEMEQEIIREALKQYGGNKSIVAEKLDISRSTLWRKIKEGEKDE